MEIPFKDGAVVYEDGRIHKFGVSVMSWQFDELSPAYPLEIISPDELVAFEGEVKREGFTENNLPGTNQPVPTGVGRANENLVMRIFFDVCLLLLIIFDFKFIFHRQPLFLLDQSGCTARQPSMSRFDYFLDSHVLRH